MTQTNAQIALLAAATVYEGGRGHTPSQSVLTLADSFEVWLDARDKLNQPAKEPELSHHITCRARLAGGQYPCNCTPIPYHGDAPAPPYQAHSEVAKERPGPKHFVSENANADPICHCGWDPLQECPWQPGPWSRELARTLIRQHVASTKPNSGHPDDDRAI